MKNRILILLLLGLSIIACRKEDEPIVFPSQLQAEVDEMMSSSPNLCKISRVEVTEFEGKRYYNFYCDIWSCAYCHFYDQDGNIPDWDADQWNQYFAEKKEIAITPACSH